MVRLIDHSMTNLSEDKSSLPPGSSIRDALELVPPGQSSGLELFSRADEMQSDTDDMAANVFDRSRYSWPAPGRTQVFRCS